MPSGLGEEAAQRRLGRDLRRPRRSGRRLGGALHTPPRSAQTSRRCRAGRRSERRTSAMSIASCLPLSEVDDHASRRRSRRGTARTCRPRRGCAGPSAHGSAREGPRRAVERHPLTSCRRDRSSRTLPAASVRERADGRRLRRLRTLRGGVAPGPGGVPNARSRPRLCHADRCAAGVAAREDHRGAAEVVVGAGGGGGGERAGDGAGDGPPRPGHRHQHQRERPLRALGERGHEPALARDVEQQRRLRTAGSGRRATCTPSVCAASLSNCGLRQRLAVDEHLRQELERRDPARAVALDLVAHRAGQVVRAADDLVPVALAERGGDVEIEPLGREHEDDRALDLLDGERRALGRARARARAAAAAGFAPLLGAAPSRRRAGRPRARARGARSTARRGSARSVSSAASCCSISHRLALVPGAVGLEHVDHHELAAALERHARQPRRGSATRRAPRGASRRPAAWPRTPSATAASARRLPSMSTCGSSAHGIRQMPRRSRDVARDQHRVAPAPEREQPAEPDRQRLRRSRSAPPSRRGGRASITGSACGSGRGVPT